MSSAVGWKARRRKDPQIPETPRETRAEGVTQRVKIVPPGIWHLAAVPKMVCDEFLQIKGVIR